MERLKQAVNKALNFTEMLHREREKRVTLKGLPPETEGVTPSKIRQGFIKEIRKGCVLGNNRRFHRCITSHMRRRSRQAHNGKLIVARCLSDEAEWV